MSKRKEELEQLTCEIELLRAINVKQRGVIAQLEEDADARNKLSEESRELLTKTAKLLRVGSEHIKRLQEERDTASEEATFFKKLVDDGAPSPE